MFASWFECIGSLHLIKIQLNNLIIWNIKSTDTNHDRFLFVQHNSMIIHVILSVHVQPA